MRLRSDRCPADKQAVTRERFRFREVEWGSLVVQQVLLTIVVFGVIAAMTPQRHPADRVWVILSCLAVWNLSVFAARWWLGRSNQVSKPAITQNEQI